MSAGDLEAMAAFAASYGFSGDYAARRWATAAQDVREHYRSVADAAVTAHGLRDVMHLMTIEMGAWCGATGPGNGRASSQWAEVTCPACKARRVTELLALAWEMLNTMGPGRQALDFAVRAGRLGVTDEQGRPLAMACAPDPHPFAGSRRDALDAQTLHDSPGSDL